MPKEDNKNLKYHHEEKSMKAPFIIYADMVSLLEQIDTCHNNLENSPTTKNNHKASGYLLFIHRSFDATKNKLSFYRDKDCMKNVFRGLKKYMTKIRDCEKKMISLTNKKNK